MSSRGLLIIVSGPSGAGKGTVLKKAFFKNANLRYSVSATTRAPRHGETEGVHYFFKTQDEFFESVRRGEFLEYEEVFGNFYGTPKAQVEELLSAGYDVVLEIDVKGALKVKCENPGAISIFLTPSERAEVERRLKNRKTETQEDIKKRIETAKFEFSEMDKYDYVIINDDATKCCDSMLEIIKKVKEG